MKNIINTILYNLKVKSKPATKNAWDIGFEDFKNNLKHNPFNSKTQRKLHKEYEEGWKANLRIL